ncbi:hypothetical protein [Polyangium sp. 15x6]|uniref:hypothetical protein n=1 Tax=Polyangium sp. 15x6 TaxID=3042687 RepID=UPI00249A94FA|nr:hypothetical protein [Polyangium sp. 15x6]MDI3282471.1 hypothetical protein [Polyangium sp. 15x6]
MGMGTTMTTGTITTITITTITRTATCITRTCTGTRIRTIARIRTRMRPGLRTITGTCTGMIRAAGTSIR